MGERGFSLRGKGIVEVDHKDQMYEERQNTQTKSTVISRISKLAVDMMGERGFSVDKAPRLSISIVI